MCNARWAWQHEKNGESVAKIGLSPSEVTAEALRMEQWAPSDQEKGVARKPHQEMPGQAATKRNPGTAVSGPGWAQRQKEATEAQVGHQG